MTDLDTCFAQMQSSGFRLETLPAYVGRGESDSFSAWRERRPLPERSPASNPYLATVQDHAGAGKLRNRVHLMSDPHALTDYERFELVSYQGNVDAGEVIRIARRADMPDLTVDFWLFDYDTPEPYVAVMDYDEAGVWHGADIRHGRAACQPYEEARQRAWSNSMILSDFVDMIRQNAA